MEGRRSLEALTRIGCVFLILSAPACVVEEGPPGLGDDSASAPEGSSEDDADTQIIFDNPFIPDQNSNGTWLDEFLSPFPILWNNNAASNGSIIGSAGDYYLRVRYPAGSIQGMQFPLVTGNHEEAYFEYKLRFEPGFDNQWLVNGDGGKLPGPFIGWDPSNTNVPIGGGTRSYCNTGSSLRLMWRQYGGMELYAYHPDMPSNYGESFDFIDPRTSSQFLAQTGRWYTIRFLVRLNTRQADGSANPDGLVRIWLTDQGEELLVLDRGDFRFSCSDSVKIHGLHFSTFFGGCPSNCAPTSTVYTNFDDFLIEEPL